MATRIHRKTHVVARYTCGGHGPFCQGIFDGSHAADRPFKDLNYFRNRGGVNSSAADIILGMCCALLEIATTSVNGEKLKLSTDQLIGRPAGVRCSVKLQTTNFAYGETTVPDPTASTTVSTK